MTSSGYSRKTWKVDTDYRKKDSCAKQKGGTTLRTVTRPEKADARFELILAIVLVGAFLAVFIWTTL
jgi:hypothetical protein